MEAQVSLQGPGSAPERSGGAVPGPDALSTVQTRPGSKDTEVEASPRRRQFSASYKLDILEQADRCTSAGELGALLRREGLYSSHLSAWRAARREGSLAKLSRKRGAKPKKGPEAKELKRLRKENARLRRELERAQKVIEVQKKVSELMGIELENPDSDGNDERD